MSDNLTCLTCCTPDSLTKLETIWPTKTRFVFTPMEILKHVNERSDCGLFIVIFLAPEQQDIDSTVDELVQNDFVFRILICGSKLNNRHDNNKKVIFSKVNHLGTNATLSALQVYNNRSRQRIESGDKDLANADELRSTLMKYLNQMNSPIKACHILIIGMNVSEHAIRRYQRRVINACHVISPNTSFQVITLEDILPDCSHEEIWEDQKAYQQRQINFIKLITKMLAPIRLYLFGNESNLNNNICVQLLNKEEPSDIHRPFCDEAPYALVNDEDLLSYNTEERLRAIHGSKCSIERHIWMNLDELFINDDFFNALQNVHTSFPQRTLEIIDALNRLAMDFMKSFPRHSDELRQTAQADDLNRAEHQDSSMDIESQIRPTTPTVSPYH